MISLHNEKLVIQKEAKLLTQYTPLRFANSKGREVQFQSALIFHPCVESPRHRKVPSTNDVIRVPSKDTPTFYPRKGFYDTVDAYRRCVTQG